MVVFVTRQDHWKRNAAWNRQRVADSIGAGEPNKLQKRGLDYYGKLMPLLYRNDWFGISTLIRRGVCFFMGLNKPFMQLGGRADQRVMIHKSCGLAAQTFMLSIVAAGYDCCPMEGFDARYVKKALNLPRRAEVNMIVSIGKGTQEGVWGERHRLGFQEVVFKR
jgi:nitroreductase